MKCDETHDALDKGAYKRHKQHLIDDTDHRQKLNLTCSVCKTSCHNKEKLLRHPCTQLKNEPVEFTPYVLKKRESNLAQVLLLSGRSDYEIAKICFEEQWAIPQFMPCANIPLAWRNGNFYTHYKSICNTSPASFYEKVNQILFETHCKSISFVHLQLLSDRLKNGLPGVIDLHKNIVIRDEDGNVILYLTEALMKPSNSKYLQIEDGDDWTFQLSLKEPIGSKVKDQPLDQRTDLRVYSRYKTDQGYPFAPHRYPKKFTEDKNCFRSPWMFQPELMENLVGMGLAKFYEFCDEVEDSPLSTIIPMMTICLALMIRLKMRLNWSNVILGGLFNLDVSTVQERFVTSILYINEHFHPIPR